MRKIYLLLLAGFIGSCTPSSNVRYTHREMPQDELTFIKKITSSDSVYNAQLNDITKTEFLEKSKKDVANYVLNHLKVNNWVAIVHNIEVNTAPADYIKVDLIVPVGNWREAKSPDFSFPMLVSLIDNKPGKIKDALKLLQKGDEVLVSGEIDKNLSGGINIESFSIAPSELTPFSNLKFDLTITDIKK